MKTIAETKTECAEDCHSVPELAKKLSISESKAWKLVWQRKIDFIRVGRRTLVTNRAYRKFLEANTVKAAS